MFTEVKFLLLIDQNMFYKLALRLAPNFEDFYIFCVRLFLVRGIQFHVYQFYKETFKLIAKSVKSTSLKILLFCLLQWIKNSIFE